MTITSIGNNYVESENVYFLGLVDKEFRAAPEMSKMTQDGAYLFMRQINNNQRKKERHLQKSLNPERKNEADFKRTFRKLGKTTEGLNS